MKNKITIVKRTYLNTNNSANFEFSDSKGRGFILMVFEEEDKTICKILNKDSEIIIKEVNN